MFMICRLNTESGRFRSTQHSKSGEYLFSPAADRQKAGKYHNSPVRRVTASGAVFCADSEKGARRYDHLTALERAGQIRDLRRQADFTLRKVYTGTEGRRMRAIRDLHTLMAGGDACAVYKK